MRLYLCSQGSQSLKKASGNRDRINAGVLKPGVHFGLQGPPHRATAVFKSAARSHLHCIANKH